MSLTLPTAAELYAVIKAEIQARNPSLTDWTEGSDLDALTGSMVIAVDQGIRIMVSQVQAAFVATATGSDLDAVVTDRYPSLTRKAAAGAVGTLVFSRGTNTGSLSIPAGTVCQGTVNGVSLQYTTTASVTMASTASTVSAAAQCSTTGPGGNAAAGTITTIVSAIAADLTHDMTVTNSDRFVGGTDAETDDAYRARAQAYPATLSLATAATLAEAAVSVPGVAYASVDESLVPSAGIVYVYVADSDGRSNAAQVALVQTAVDAVRAAGVLVTAAGSTREEVDLSVTVYVRAGYASDTLSAAVSAAILAYTGGLTPNAPIYFSAVEAAAIGVDADNIFGAEASSTSTTSTTKITAAHAQDALRVPSTSLTVTLVES